MSANPVDDSRRVRFEHYVPRPPLADFVAVFWYWRGHSAPRSTERLLPIPTMELVIRLDGSAASAGVSGPHSEASLIERSATDELLGIHFKPSGAAPFLAVPLGDLHNRHVALEDLWGARASARLVERLRAAPTAALKFRILEDRLYRAAARPIARHPIAAFALDAFRRDTTLHSSARAAAALGVSQRRFINVFRDEVGLTPKLYCRIGRFQDVIARVAHEREVDWADVALACGYYDQAHFAHDFRAFTGLRPTEYLGLRIPGQLNHVRVPA